MKTLLLILVLPLSLWGQEIDKALDAKINLSGVKPVVENPQVAIQPLPGNETTKREFNGGSSIAQSSSVRPAIAACPQSVKAPVDSGLLGKILVPYDNSLFLRSDLPYFLGDSYVPRSSVERARSILIP